ncbi:MAG: hypothetical protein R3286_08895, partial [Gammaproteobacteria bacterium]|nr:hypothetical protein [Gammaproteobacteria bacterium]
GGPGGASAGAGNAGGGGIGGGHGGGRGGGRGGVAGGPGPSGQSGKSGKGDTGRGHAKGLGVGHSRHGDEVASYGRGRGHGIDGGVSASSLGALNAAHAAPAAYANAAPNSAVGAVAAFARAVESETLTDEERVEAAAQALASKANKEITAPVVSEVANLANVAVDDETANAIAARAAEIQGASGN